MLSPADHDRTGVYATILRAALEAAQPEGVTYKYFQGAKWEAELRDRFAIARRSLCTSSASISDLHHALHALDRRYRTRAKAEHIQCLAQIIMELCARTQWATNGAPALLACSDTEAALLGTVVKDCLQRMEEARCNRTYSLLTKAMHFLFPHTFAIYDSQICHSMWTLSLYAQNNMDGITKYKAAITLTTGENYPMVLSVYREVWRNASAHDRDAAQRAVADLDRLVQQAGADAHVSILDMIDKYLWHADGHPALLQLPWNSAVEGVSRVAIN